LAEVIKPFIFEVHGLAKVIDVDTTEKLVTSACCDIGSMPNARAYLQPFLQKTANNGKITTFTGYRSLMPSCAGFLEPRKSRPRPSKSKFNAENLVYSFSMSISIDFGAVRS